MHILDPFTGTGTFITRLMQNRELIPEDKLTYKYENDLHAFDIVPLAYYVASMNIEAVYHEICPQAEFKAKTIVSLTDTFSSSKKNPATKDQNKQLFEDKCYSDLSKNFA